jgi:hypothetical protein
MANQLEPRPLTIAHQQVSNSNGDGHYTVHLLITCDCVGFRFHQRCRHTKQAVLGGTWIHDRMAIHSLAGN